MAGIKSEEEMRAGRIAQNKAITDALNAASGLRQGIKSSPWGKEVIRKADAGLFGLGGATPALAGETTLAPVLPQIDITKGGEASSPLKGIGLDAQSLADINKPLSYAGAGITPAATPSVEAPVTDKGQLTIPTPGMSTRIGNQDFSKYDTPTEFGIMQGKKAVQPGAGGEYDWNKIRGMDNVTIAASGMKLTPEGEEQVEKKKLMREYEKEMRTPYASVEKIKAMERRLGIGNQMTEAQRAANVLERDKMKQALDLAEADRNMKEEDKVMQIALALSPTFKTKDLNDMEEKITETKDLSIYEAMLNDGSIKGKAAERLAKALEMVKSKQRKVLKPGDVVDGLRYKGGDPKKEGNWEKE